MMKKTILSIAVGMASFGAVAATGISTDAVSQGVENIEVFGKLGVSYDNLDAIKQEDDVKEINYLRNTEIGIKTGAELDHDLKASAVVVGNFNQESNTGEDDFGLDRLELGVEHQMGAVHFGKIDNRYDMATSKFDQFNDVFSGTDFEQYSTTGKVEGIALSASPVANLGLAVQFSEGTSGDLGDAVAVTATYAVSGVDFAAAYASDKAVNSGEHDADGFKLGAGYGINNFYAGVIYEAQEGFNKEEIDSISLSGSYKLDSLVLKAGYIEDEVSNIGQSDYDIKTVRLAAEYALRDNVSLNAGYAKVDNSSASEKEDLLTAGMIIRF